MFVLKKIVSLFFAPLNLILLVGLIGLLLLWFTQRQRMGRILLTIGFVGLLVLSSSFVSKAFLVPLERAYPAYVAQTGFQPDYVVVLSCGSKADTSLPATSQLGVETMVRLVEGIRIFRAHPQSKLLVSGSSPFDLVPDAQIMARAARELGVPDAAIVIEDQSLDTADEARIVQQMIGDAPFVLVTSASHLPRSMALFRKLGMDPVPAPAAHRVKYPIQFGLFYLFDPGHLVDIHAAVHEYIGLVWAKLRQLI